MTGPERTVGPTDGGDDGRGRSDPDARRDTIDASILVIDNYDSFAYNLVQYVGEVASEVTVRRNDEVDVEGIHDLDPDGVVVSPGPGRPEDAGVTMPVFEETTIPALGVCLGHQGLCAVHGAEVVQAPEIVHGKHSIVDHDGEGVFRGLPDRLRVGRYHSLAVSATDLPDALVETARTVDDERSILMGVRHRERPHYGVQFHPESILTGEANDADPVSLEIGKRLIENFCAIAAEERSSSDR